MIGLDNKYLFFTLYNFCQKKGCHSRQLNLRSIVVKKYRPQRSNRPIISKENLLNQDFSTKTICEKWAADITYIPTKRNGCVTYLQSWIYTRKRLLAIHFQNE